MSGDVAYLDTSAFLKLLVDEPESSALRGTLAAWPRQASASLLRTEAVRALLGSGNDELLGAARRLSGAIHMIRLEESLLDQAGTIGPPGLRSLDAIHLAAALSVGHDLGVFVTYDDRLGEAATHHGLEVIAPR